MIFFTFDSDDPHRKFNRIYTSFHRAVLSRTLTLLGNHHDAEDAAQETWQTVFRNLRSLSEDNSDTLKATILKIATNKAIDLFRKRCRHENKTAEPEAADRENTVSDSLFSAICEKESVQVLWECLRTIDARYTDVLRLYYLQENNTREIAKILGVNVKTVETRLARGRALLAQKIKERGLP